MDTLNFFTDYLIASLRLSVPLAFAALGGLFSERSGVLNIGLEGMLLSGAFASAAGAFFTGNVWLGMLLAIVVGGLVGLLHAYLCVTLRVDQLVSGLAINLTAAGLTSFWSRVLFNSGQAQQLPGIQIIGIPGLKNIPVIGNLLFNQDPLIYLLFLLVPLSTYLLFRTSLGLSLRAVGEYPRAADTAGVSVTKVRYVAVTLSGCLAGLGGAYLTLVHVRFFVEDMSAGRGFIALAALIFGRWHPVSTALACLLFGATEALQLRIQAFNLNIPYQFLVMLPYVIALLALVGLAGKSTPPAALGVPYIPESREQ
ncbi:MULTISPECIES: ABC transporter permease [unclassified Coleofasciculus]|uniref:ABC transporter permease n=1 Tax=Cyanophyceae TaxID=3028117 RepID=UPI001685B419|nr:MULTISPECIES: ABC transporter permease [unclassified Coleofasciculus]MBD2084540.1 ABC transporter permease [Coleofasciculus sp. FACHB-542]MBD2539220.1 ABC transporter permease [Coleofasciculus sp. FACHB-SPT36]